MSTGTEARSFLARLKAELSSGVHRRDLPGPLRALVRGARTWALVMLGLRTAPKDDSGYSPAKAVYGTNLSLPGEFIEHSEFPPGVFLRKMKHSVSVFSGPSRHHVPPS